MDGLLPVFNSKPVAGFQLWELNVEAFLRASYLIIALAERLAERKMTKKYSFQ